MVSRRIPHVRAPIVTTDGSPTKVFYDLLDRLGASADSDDTIELLNYLTSSVGEADKLRSEIEGAKLAAVLSPDAFSYLADMERRLAAIELDVVFIRTMLDFVASIEQRLSALETAVSLTAAQDNSQLQARIDGLEFQVQQLIQGSLATA